MTNQKNDRYCTNREWLLECAEFEREHTFGVAGSENDSEEQVPTPRTPISEQPQHERSSVGAFAQLVEYGRRRQGLTIEALASTVRVDLEELVEIERADASPSPRTLHRLAKFLGLPAEPLAEVAGLVRSRDDTLEDAVYRFAARSEPNTSLNAEEEEAYQSFVKVLISKVSK